ncbi:MAG TPA: hypothetical protein VLM75_09880 [Spirochaetota bacterium]|nr:hypothetical protein [Spirochaetota bacterium]
MKRLHVWCLVLPLLLSGCIVRGVSIMNQAELPKDDMGYLYGRFRMENTGNVGLELVLTNMKNGLQYRIPLGRGSLFGKRKSDIYAFALRPGEYRLTHIATVIAARGQINEQLSQFSDDRYSRPITVQAGMRQYLADFTGNVEISTFTASWGLSRITDNYEETTNGLNELYAGLRGMPSRRLFE